MQKRHVIIIAGIVLTIVLGVFGMQALSSLKPETEKKEKPDIIRYVQAEPVKYTTIETKLELTGRVSSQHFIDLSSEVQGRIQQGSVPLKKGQSFKKGQLLVSIFNRDAAYAVKARKSRFMSLVANLLPDFKIDFPDSYPEWLKFFEDTDINEKLPELPEIKSAKQKTYLASGNILSEYYGIKSDEVRLSKYKLYAPFDGTFSEVFSEAGSVANPGGRIARLIRTDKMELELPVELSDVKFLNVGDKAKVISDDGKHHYQAKIIRISDFVDPKTQSVPIFLSISEKEKPNIFQGEYLQAEFDRLKISDAMKITRNAVFNHNEVFVVINGKLKKRTINIIKTNEKSLIFNGINEGEMLVSEALLNANENMEVKILDSKQ